MQFGLERGQQGRLSRPVATAYGNQPGRASEHVVHGLGERGAVVFARVFHEADPAEADALGERRVGGGKEMGAHPLDACPDGNEVGDARSQLVHVQRHLDLPGQRGGEGDEQCCLTDFPHGDPGGHRQDQRQRDQAAGGTPAFAHQDRADLRRQRVLQTLAKIAMPAGEVVAVAGKNVVPGGVGASRHAVGHGLIAQPSIGQRLPQAPLQRR